MILSWIVFRVIRKEFSRKPSQINLYWYLWMETKAMFNKAVEKYFHSTLPVS